MKILKIVTSMATIAALSPLLAHATTLACGPNVCYQYNETQDASLYFGLPTLFGDTMRFTPPNFQAESLNGQGLVSLSKTWLFDNVYATTTGMEIGNVIVREAGDYYITGDSSGAPDTVGVNLYTQVANNASTEVAFDIKNFSASGNSASPWVLTSTAINPSLVFSAVANDVAVSIQNTLTASTDELGGDAFIQKKFVVEIGTVVPNVVPVPAAAWLFGSAFGLLGFVRRRAA